MLVALTKKDHVKKVAKYTTKEEGPFICPCCHEDVIFKNGNLVSGFFSHKTATECVYGVREKEIQRRAKMELYDILLERGIDVELEYTLNEGSHKTFILDIFMKLPQGLVAVMFNGNMLTPAEVRQYITACHEVGVVVFWASFVKGTDIKSRYLPTAFEKFIHNYQKGTIYYWAGGADFKACHFAPYEPKNKLLERTYGKYVVRQIDDKKRDLFTMTLLTSTHKTLPGMLYPFLIDSNEL